MHMTKFHQQMRPRLFNPTQQTNILSSNSSHVGTSLGMFSSMYYGNIENRRAASNGKVTDNYQNYPPISPQQPRASSKHYESLPYPNQSQTPRQKNQNIQKISNQRLVTNQSSQFNQSPVISRGQGYSLPKPNSYLSNYGTQSLLIPQLSQRDIYEKQQKNYNIISIKPKQYNETIKKYPKYRLENEDANFYKKIQLQNQYRQGHHEQEKMRQWQMMQNYQENVKNQRNQNNPKSDLQPKQIMAGIPTDFVYRDLHPSAPFNN